MAARGLLLLVLLLARCSVLIYTLIGTFSSAPLRPGRSGQGVLGTVPGVEADRAGPTWAFFVLLGSPISPPSANRACAVRIYLIGLWLVTGAAVLWAYSRTRGMGLLEAWLIPAASSSPSRCSSASTSATPGGARVPEHSAPAARVPASSLQRLGRRYPLRRADVYPDVLRRLCLPAPRPRLRGRCPGRTAARCC